ncbi:hypothetical protein RJ641_007105 [Dillenia turbinata]|uniref:Uncharacterized protein n=1 Tax=Dillenia turbinata TaxID=194707 RepID=A0AAN8Z6N4_9MAGN
MGSIPNSIGNLSLLKVFYLANNQMDGTIPASLGQLSSLVDLDLSENPWQGVITEAHLFNLTSLKELSLAKLNPNVTLAFNVNENFLPPFKLTYLNLRSCHLGPRFPAWLRGQNELNTIVLNTAGISDSIPDWFWELDLQVNELDFANNQLRGRVPNTLQFQYPAIVDLRSNLFGGPLPVFPSNMSHLYLGDNAFSGPIPRDIGIKMPNLVHKPSEI